MAFDTKMCEGLLKHPLQTRLPHGPRDTAHIHYLVRPDPGHCDFEHPRVILNGAKNLPPVTHLRRPFHPRSFGFAQGGMGCAKGHLTGTQGVMLSAYGDREVQGVTGGAIRHNGTQEIPCKHHR